jgi:murein DD-endopeptidase MepM/ murein hydrolase activator NlpD
MNRTTLFLVSAALIASVATALALPVTARAQQAPALPCQVMAEIDAMRTLIVNGTRMSSGFGPRMNPVLGTPELHEGVDVAAPMGEPIHAAADGMVIIAWLCGSYGNYVRIRHADDIATGYAHVSRFAKGIFSGVHVKAGQVIAYVGSTGLSTGPHLHYEVFVKGWPVKPSCSCTR